MACPYNRKLKQLINFFPKLLCFLLFVNSALAQFGYHFTTYTQEDEIASGTLVSIEKDSTGFLWLLSENGLSRFDGYTFKTYRHSTTDPSSISSSDVKKMLVHKSGKILFQTANSICSYNPLNESFKSLITFQNYWGFHNFICNNDGFWVIKQDCLIYINPQDEKVITYNFPKEIPDAVFINKKDVYNSIWLNNRDEVASFNPSTKTFSKIPVQYLDEINHDSRNAPLGYFSDLSGTPCFYSLDGLFKFSQQHQCFVQISQSTIIDDPTNIINGISKIGNYIILPYRYDKLCVVNMFTGKEKTMFIGGIQSPLRARIALNGIYPSDDGALWISTPDHGLFHCKPETGAIEELKHNESEQNSLPSNNIEDVFEDKNLLWMISPGLGLVKAEHLTPAFASYKPFNKHMTQPYEFYKNIRAICELDNDNLLIGTLDGMYQFNKNTKTFQTISSPIDGSPMFQNSSISKILVDSAKNIWICHWNRNGVSIINYQNRKVATLNPYSDPSINDYSTVRCMYLDSHGFLWIGTSGDLICRINTKKIDYQNSSNNHFERFKGVVTKTDTLIFNVTFTIAENGNHEILIGSQSGFYKYSYITNKFTRFINHPGNLKSISDDNVRSFYIEKNSTTWIGTNGGGLNRFDEATQTFKSYSIENGLPGNSVYSILDDDKGNLWLGTNKGICRFNIATESCRNYSLMDGLQNYEFNTNAACKLSTGELVFGGIKGFNIFHPDSLVIKTEIPKIVITQFKVGEKQMPISNETIQLSHEQNYISFQFAALNYFRNGENIYAYKLEGLDKDWVYCGDRRFTNYANLSPGTYTFKVKAANYYGEWNETGTELKLRISTPWYNTWLFKILTLLILSLLMYAVFRYRLKQKLKLQDVRNRIASDLHDEIGSTLSSVYIYSEVAQNTAHENKISESSQYMKYISADVAKMIDSLGDIVWTVNAKNDRFENIINRMRSSAIELFDAKGYELHLDFDESLNALKLGMAERKNFYLFYKEAINNVAKYADGKTVSIGLTLNKSQIELSIVDDGKGFELSKKSEGNGMNNMKKRAVDLKGKFEIYSSPNKGTTVKLSFLYS